MSQQEQEQLIQRYIEAYNLFDVAAMLACLHENVTFENVSGGEVTIRTEGKVAFETQARQAVEWFMERCQSIETLRCQNQQAEADIDFFAITSVDLPNGIKAGTILQLTGKSIFTFQGNTIRSIQDIT